MAKKPEYRVEFVKSKSGLKGFAVLNSKGREVAFDTSEAEALIQCEGRNGGIMARYKKVSAEPMTNEQMLKELISITKPGDSGPCGILLCDLVSQDALFEFQEKMSTFLCRLGNNVDGGAELLEKEFPRLFRAS